MLALLASMAVSFIVTYLIAPYFMQFLHDGGIIGMDLHKKSRPRLPTSGGVCVGFGIITGILAYVGLNTFVLGVTSEALDMLAVLSSVLIVMFVGFMDDINVKAKAVMTKEGLDIRVGFPQWAKPLLTIPAAIPLMVVNAGQTVMGVPFIGAVDFGILYPLLLIPIGVVGASNAINLIGGFNGVESGMGMVYMLGLGAYGLMYGSSGASIFLISFAALLAFLRYNWYPAKFLPGDSLTYLLGAIVASGIIVGNMEKIGAIMLTPFIIELLLKLRAGMKASCLGKLRPDGKLDPPYGKDIYSLTHMVMNIRPLTERQVTIIMMGIEAVFVIIPFLHIV
jgi:UDP-N-acetylglucosamine--dolichyl-phosphate N-acetylglucosaminephosphotransferase